MGHGHKMMTKKDMMMDHTVANKGSDAIFTPKEKHLKVSDCWSQFVSSPGTAEVYRNPILPH